MDVKKRQQWGLALVVLDMMLMVALVVGCGAQPPWWEDEDIVALGTTHFSGLDVTGTETDLLVVNQTSTGDIVEFRDNGTVVWRLADGGAVTQGSGLLTLGAGVTLSDGDAVVADDLRITAQTAITVTNGAAFTPTGTYQGLQVSNASSEVTPTVTMAGTAGDLLVLINTTTPTISIADSGTTMLSAEWEAGQYDSLVLWCDGTNWIELSRTNN